MSDTSQNHDFPGGSRARIVTTSPIYDTCRAIQKYLLNRRPTPLPPGVSRDLQRAGAQGRALCLIEPFTTVIREQFL